MPFGFPHFNPRLNGAFFMPACLGASVAFLQSHFLRLHHCGREGMAYVQGASLKVMLPSTYGFHSRLLRRPQG